MKCYFVFVALSITQQLTFVYFLSERIGNSRCLRTVLSGRISVLLQLFPNVMKDFPQARYAIIAAE